MHLIDYGHMRDGVLYHGTISDMDGSPKSTWRISRGSHGHAIGCRAAPPTTWGCSWAAASGAASCSAGMELAGPDSAATLRAGSQGRGLFGSGSLATSATAPDTRVPCPPS